MARHCLAAAFTNVKSSFEADVVAGSEDNPPSHALNDDGHDPDAWSSERGDDTDAGRGRRLRPAFAFMY